MSIHRNSKKTWITLDTPVDELASKYPRSIRFLTEHGVRCIRCGEPLWCSVGELFRQEKVEDPEGLIHRLNDFLDEHIG